MSELQVLYGKLFFLRHSGLFIRDSLLSAAGSHSGGRVSTFGGSIGHLRCSR